MNSENSEKGIQKSKKLIAFSFVVEDIKDVINVTATQQGLTHSFEKFAFVIANKYVKKR